MTVITPCLIPPAGWSCTRSIGHDGPCAAIRNAGAWASPTLGRAYADIEKLRHDLAQNSENPIDETLRRALEAIEAADCELVGVS